MWLFLEFGEITTICCCIHLYTVYGIPYSFLLTIYPIWNGKQRILHHLTCLQVNLANVATFYQPKTDGIRFASITLPAKLRLFWRIQKIHHLALIYRRRLYPIRLTVWIKMKFLLFLLLKYCTHRDSMQVISKVFVRQIVPIYNNAMG